MNSDRLWPEVVIAGFCHLVWLMLLVSLIINPKPIALQTFIAGISGISGGAAALLGTALIGASFFLGTLANHLLTHLSIGIAKCLGNEPHDDKSLDEKRDNNRELIRSFETKCVGKSLFRSVYVAGIFIIALSLCWSSKLGSTNAKWTIIIVGSLLGIASLVAFAMASKEVAVQYAQLSGQPISEINMKPIVQRLWHWFGSVFHKT